MIEGYKNLLLKNNQQIETLSKQRMSICNSCKENKLGVCKLCGCILKAKTRELNQKCKINKW